MIDRTSPGLWSALAVVAVTALAWLAGCNQAGSNGAVDAPKSGALASAPASDTEVPANAAGELTIAPADSAVQQTAYTAAAPDKPKDKPKYDPIEENGKFFEGWKKPKLALVISGRQDGYLEPCGCAGLERQKGGLSRRYTLLEDLRKRGWPLAAVDVGSIVRRFGHQAEIQYSIVAEALRKMGYGAVGFGPGDLRLSAGEIVAAVAGAKPEDSIFVSANVSLFGLTPKVRIIEAGGLKLGVTAVLGKEYQQLVNNSEIEITPAAEALKGVVDELKGCDYRILLANATTEEATELAKKFPMFDLVVEAGKIDIPRDQPEKIAGTKARLIEMGEKGMYVVVVGFYDDPKQPLKFQRVALDSRFGDAPPMKELMATYQDQLKQLGWEGLGLKPVPHPRSQKGDKLAGAFATAASCKECHPTAYNVWAKSKHVHATEALVKADPPRQFDPECISCHATGWNPSEFFPYVGGFDSLETTPQLAGNSCENCHGPSAAHVAAEKATRKNQSKIDAERQALKLTVATARDNICAKCHDHDNSPDFAGKDAQGRDNFDVHYWPKVEHKGKR